MDALPIQTFSTEPLRPSKEALKKQFVGKRLAELRTPCAIVDVGKVRRNTIGMLKVAEAWGINFRAHVKTHKTTEATLSMLDPYGDGTLTASRAIAATMPEAWGLLDESQAIDPADVEKMRCTLSEVLYSLPLPLDKIEELYNYRLALRKFSRYGSKAQLRLMIDNIAQVEALQAWAEENMTSAAQQQDCFSVFIKCESGNRRAGVHPESDYLRQLLSTIKERCPIVSVYGFYAHAGNSYASTSSAAAQVKLSEEIATVNKAAIVAKGILFDQTVAGTVDGARHEQPFVLSVGSTPTAHAAHDVVQAKAALANLEGGKVELHAGNYPFLDLQQLATKAIPTRASDHTGNELVPDCCDDKLKVQQSVSNVAFTVLSTVIADYPGRASGPTDAETGAPRGDGAWSADGRAKHGDEAMCDAGGIALSRDVGPFGGLGHIVWPKDKYGWEINRASQEHGLLSVRQGGPEQWAEQWQHEKSRDGQADQHQYPTRVYLGERIQIIPQHSCLTAAQFPWYYVVDSRDASGGQIVQDVCVPWKFW